MVKKQGERLKQYETKSNIIKYILENNGPVREPDIRKYLDEKYGIKDQSRINRHLHELKKDNYIELIPPTKTCLRNKWDIIKFEHLSNIKIKIRDEESFKKILLNAYEKSLMILCQKSGYNIKTLEGLKIYNRMLLSPSFFDTCMDTDIETLYYRLYNIYFNLYEYRDYHFIRKPLNEFHIIHIENPKFEIWSKTIHETTEGWTHKKRENSIENFQITKDEDREKYIKTDQILGMDGFQQSEFKLSRLNLLLEYFLNYDMLVGTDSPHEIEFVKKIKENEATRDILLTESKDQKDWEIVTIKWFLNDLKLESELIFKCKQPSFFSDNHNTSDDVYQGLIDFFGFRNLLNHSSEELLS
jgi:hypothetical protein